MNSLIYGIMILIGILLYKYINKNIEGLQISLNYEWNNEKEECKNTNELTCTSKQNYCVDKISKNCPLNKNQEPLFNNEENCESNDDFIWCGTSEVKENCYKKPKKCKEIINHSIKKVKFNKCHIWAGGGALIKDLKPNMKKLDNIPEDNKNNSFETRHTSYYIQYYPYITTSLKTNKGEFDLSRRTIFTIPKKIMPTKGWPILINFEFMTNDGYSLWYETEQEIPGGLGKDINKDSEFNIKEYYNTLKLCVYNGIAIIHVSQLNYNVYPSYECEKSKSNKSPFSSSPHGGICWNNGDNYLKYYLDKIFNLLKENNINEFKKIIPDISSDIIFDYSNISLLGYSGPSHMVSRCINDFPFTKTDKGYCYPDIKSCIMIGGGSLHCYEDGSNGKCPTNVTEPNYDNGNICWDNHPPVLLCQYKDDYDADPRASIHYFNILNRKGVKVYRLSKDSWNHALPKCNTISTPDICNNFLIKHMK